MNKLLSLLVMCSSMFCMQAQQDLVMYNMESIYQSGYTNPAFKPNAKMHIGLPALSSIYVRHQNTFLNPYHLFENSNTGVAFRTEHFLGTLDKKNYLGVEAAIDLFSIGMKINESYLSFEIREKVSARFNMPSQFLIFPFEGNISTKDTDVGASNELDFSGLDMRLNHYREYGFRYQQKLGEWDFGVRLKYLYGMENINVKRSDLTWNTDPETYDYTFTGQLEVNSSGFGPLFDNDSDEEGVYDIYDEDYKAYLLKRKNNGLGIDLGVSRKFGEKLEVSASLVDLGYIKWKTYNKNLVTNDVEILFNGINIPNEVLYSDTAFADSLDVHIENMMQGYEDQLEASENEDSYRSSLQTRFYIGANYQLYEGEKSKGYVGALIQSEIYKGKLSPTFTLSYNQDFQRWLSATIAYSVMDKDFRNLGLGLRANLGPVQIYGTVDNLLAMNFANIQYGSDPDDSFRYPHYSKNVQAHVGMNISLFREKKDSDHDGIADKVDKCPFVPGKKMFFGCPDTDGDGIKDEDDQCPNIKGIRKFNGCPDTDGDDVEDRRDDCPTEKGPIDTNGCPDTDRDGIQDSMDDCPKKKGTIQFKGCPDTDEDGIKDSDDDCPKDKGLVEFKGCPDTDMDGIMDKEDRCPKEAGPIDNEGCPYGDQDGDGINDDMDVCPKTPGVPENNGCPAIKKEEQEILNTAFENLEFVTGKDQIKSSSFASLDNLADLLQKKDEWKLSISGHTDDVGNDDNNMQLSEKRAKSVAKYLESKGVRKERIFTKWFGESEPVAPNDTEEGRQKNRRVEMEVIFD